jgi:uncharacterized protein DUF2703
MMSLPIIWQRLVSSNPSESNRIWIAGRPMEEWLGARVGSSRCCSVCGDSECRTVEVEGTTFETIRERLLLEAALIASSQLLDLTSEAARNEAPGLRRRRSERRMTDY